MQCAAASSLHLPLKGSSQSQCKPKAPITQILVLPYDKDLLQFALNEHLEADFFLYGALGKGLDSVARELVHGGPAPIGAKKASLDKRTVQLIEEFGYQQVGHLRKTITKPIRLSPPNGINLSKSTKRSNRRGVCVKSCMSNKEGIRVETVGKNSSNLEVRDGDAIVIVDHGSRSRESNLMLNEFVEMFKGRTGYRIVEPAHMEMAEPSMSDAFRLCVQQGANRIIVSPLFLFLGQRLREDIPSLAAEAAREHSNISYIITAPLGLHELLVDVVNDRIKQSSA